MSAIESAVTPAWIASRDSAAAFCREALNHTTVALDTEFIRTQTYFAELGLVQLAIVGQIVWVDPLIAGVAAELKELDAFPAFDDDPSFYTDFGETGPYVAEIGESECAT